MYEILKPKVEAYRMLANQINELEYKKKILGTEIMQMLERNVKTHYIDNFRIQRTSRLLIKTSIEQARILGATKHEEIVDKDMLKRLHELGKPVPGVAVSESIAIFENNPNFKVCV